MRAYEHLQLLFARLRALDDASGILGWDAQTLMPVGAAAGRADQLATLRGIAHDLLVAPDVGDLLRQGEAEPDAGTPLGPWRAANLREMRRAHAHAVAVPHDLVVASSRATSRAEMVWREARAASDFALLSPHLKEVLHLQREVARCKGEALGVAPYDALLDQLTPACAKPVSIRSSTGCAPRSPASCGRRRRARPASRRRWRSPVPSPWRRSARWARP